MHDNMSQEQQPVVEERPPSQQRPSSKPTSNGDLEGETLSCPNAPGRLSGFYDVQKAVGKGGYAIVYKAIRREDGRVVAVKKVEIFEMSQKKRERCLQEVKLLQQLDHPNIIQMLDAFIDENQLIIVFEWAPAGDLKRLIKKTAESGKPLDEAAIWNFFSQITDALRYMHQARIMHRDIKPANVLVGVNGTLKLGDLGLGRQLSEQTLEAFSKVGTPYYVSPEVVRGAGYDWKSDVWSLGCLLYELAVLRSPFEMEGANLYDVFQKISKGEYTPLPADQFSAPLRQLVMRMLQTDPNKRPELEECWSITRQIVDAQNKSRTDVHSVAEELTAQLGVLATEVSYRMSQTNGKRAGLPTPPKETLRLLHPLFFAEPLVNKGHWEADNAQKKQLGVFMHIFAWLLRVNNKQEAASQVEKFIDFAATGRSSTPPAGKGSKKSATSAMAPMCNNLLEGSSCCRKAAQSLGLSTEFAPVNAIAPGHGRAVCTILQDVLDMTYKKLQLSCRQPKHVVETDEDAAEIDDVEGDMRNVITAATLSAYADPEEEEAYLLESELDAMRLASSAQASSSAPSDGDAESAAAPTVMMANKIDAAAWQAEVERLAPQLKQIRVAATAYTEWNERLGRMRSSVQDLSKDCPIAINHLNVIYTMVANDVDRMETTERRLSEQNMLMLDKLKSSQGRLLELQQEKGKVEELLEIGNSAMEQLNSQIEAVKTSIAERTGTLDGSGQLALMRDAMKKLRGDIMDMDTRLGVLRHTLDKKSFGRKLAVNMGQLPDEDDDDDLY